MIKKVSLNKKIQTWELQGDKTSCRCISLFMDVHKSLGVQDGKFRETKCS